MNFRPRQPKGTPTGGRFTSRSRSMSDVSIDQTLRTGDAVHLPVTVEGMEVYTADAHGRILSKKPYDRDGEQTVEVATVDGEKTFVTEYPVAKLQPYPLPGLTSS